MLKIIVLKFYFRVFFSSIRDIHKNVDDYILMPGICFTIIPEEGNGGRYW